jgi:hypothetical protein
LPKRDPKYAKNIDMINVEFSKVIPTEDQVDILYDLLMRREHRISNKIDPAFEDHVKFVNSNPYRAWYIVVKQSKPVGTLYISKENTVGINLDGINYEKAVLEIINYVKKNYLPLPELKSVRAPTFSINVPPKNLSLIKILEGLDKEILQISYALE